MEQLNNDFNAYLNKMNQDYAKELVELMLKDPFLDEIGHKYIKKNMLKYFEELADKYESISYGLLIALEHHLEK